MFRLDNILEKWAAMYKPISHNADDKDKHGFYRIDIDYRDGEWIKNFDRASSPCMAYGTQVDGMLQGNGNISYQHRIIFLVKQNLGGTTKTNADRDLDAAECKFFANDMTLDLLAFLQRLKKAASNDFRGLADPVLLPFSKITDSSAMRGLQIETANWATIPVRYNGWWICELDIIQIVQRPLCIVNEKYTTE